jgi:hypothetical protein
MLLTRRRSGMRNTRPDEEPKLDGKDNEMDANWNQPPASRAPVSWSIVFLILQQPVTVIMLEKIH